MSGFMHSDDILLSRVCIPRGVCFTYYPYLSNAQQIACHSDLSTSVGFLSAAFKAWKNTVVKAINKASPAANIKC